RAARGGVASPSHPAGLPDIFRDGLLPAQCRSALRRPRLLPAPPVPVLDSTPGLVERQREPPPGVFVQVRVGQGQIVQLPGAGRDASPPGTPSRQHPAGGFGRGRARNTSAHGHSPASSLWLFVNVPAPP